MSPDERAIEYRPRVSAATARRIVADLFAADRVPPLPCPGDRAGRAEISAVSRLWLGAAAPV